MSEWILTEEGLPDDDELVVVKLPWDIRLAVFYANARIFEEHMSCNDLKPTHWLRLPSLPPSSDE